MIREEGEGREEMCGKVIRKKRRELKRRDLKMRDAKRREVMRRDVMRRDVKRLITAGLRAGPQLELGEEGMG